MISGRILNPSKIKGPGDLFSAPLESMVGGNGCHFRLTIRESFQIYRYKNFDIKLSIRIHIVNFIRFIITTVMFKKDLIINNIYFKIIIINTTAFMPRISSREIYTKENKITILTKLLIINYNYSFS